MAFTLAVCILFSQGVALSESSSTTKRQKITMAAARKIALGREAGIIKSGEREKEKAQENKN